MKLRAKCELKNMKTFDNIRVKDFELIRMTDFEPTSTEALTTVDMFTAIWSDEMHPSPGWF